MPLRPWDAFGVTEEAYMEARETALKMIDLLPKSSAIEVCTMTSGLVLAHVMANIQSNGVPWEDALQDVWGVVFVMVPQILVGHATPPQGSKPN